MITEDYCSYDVAELLNEKGFEIDTNKDYWKIGEDGTMYFMSSIGAYTSNPHSDYAFYRPENSYPCPTHQMAMKWLREEHKISIDICVVQGRAVSYMFNIWDFSVVQDNKFIGGTFDLREQLFDFPTYEEAVEAALKYCLENLI